MNKKKKLIQKILICSLLTFLLSIFAFQIYFNSRLLFAAESASPSLTAQIAGESRQEEQIFNQTTPNVPTQEFQSDLTTTTLNTTEKVEVAVTSEPTFQPTSEPTPISTPARIVYIEIADFLNYKTYKIKLQENETAFSSLLRLSEDYSFSLEYQNYGSLGAFIKCINGICADSNSYWALYYNGAYSQKGASLLRLFSDDTVNWRLEKYL